MTSLSNSLPLRFLLSNSPQHSESCHQRQCAPTAQLGFLPKSRGGEGVFPSLLPTQSPVWRQGSWEKEKMSKQLIKDLPPPASQSSSLPGRSPFITLPDLSKCWNLTLKVLNRNKRLESKYPFSFLMPILTWWLLKEEQTHEHPLLWWGRSLLEVLPCAHPLARSFISCLLGMWETRRSWS